MKAEQLRAFALSLPATTEEPHFHYTSFRVKGKIFVTVPPDEEYAHIFVDEEHREMATVVHAKFAETLLWGKKSVGIRVKLAKAKLGVVKELVVHAWRLKAPKNIAKEYPISDD